MNNPIRALVCTCLMVAILLGARLIRLLSIIEAEVSRSSESLNLTTEQIRETLASAQSVLLSVRSTTEAVRRSSVSQLGYYEAIGRRTSYLLGETAILIRQTDARMERLTGQASDLLNQSASGVETVRKAVAATTETASKSLTAATDLAGIAQEKLESANIAPMVANLTTASENLAATSAATREAMDQVRMILAPTRKGFWRRLLEAFIPRASDSAIPAQPAR